MLILVNLTKSKLVEVVKMDCNLWVHEVNFFKSNEIVVQMEEAWKSCITKPNFFECKICPRHFEPSIIELTLRNILHRASMAMPMNGLNRFGKWSHLNVIFLLCIIRSHFFIEPFDKISYKMKTLVWTTT